MNFKDLREAISINKDVTPPAMLVLKRRGVRVFPDGQKVALFTNDHYGLTFSVPYGDLTNVSNPIVGVHESSDYAKRRKSEEDIISGKKKPKTPSKSAVNDYFKRRKAEKANEEVEQVNELSPATLTSYQNAAGKDFRKGYTDPTKRSDVKTKKTIKGFFRAQKRLDKADAE